MKSLLIVVAATFTLSCTHEGDEITPSSESSTALSTSGWSRWGRRFDRMTSAGGIRATGGLPRNAPCNADADDPPGANARHRYDHPCTDIPDVTVAAQSDPYAAARSLCDDACHDECVDVTSDECGSCQSDCSAASALDPSRSSGWYTTAP